MSEARTSLERDLATDLLSIGAVSFNPTNPYIWASGLRAPVYCDNRLTISYPDVRRKITDGFLREMEARAYAPSLIAGTATAGIPHAAWLADRLNLPLAYVRSSSKAHGKSRRVEGRVEPGKPVIVVEDLVSTGMSSLDAVSALEAEGADVLAVLAIFSYGLQRAADAFAEAGVPLHALTSFEMMVAAAESRDTLDASTARAVRQWQQDPAAWSERFST